MIINQPITRIKYPNHFLRSWSSIVCWILLPIIIPTIERILTVPKNIRLIDKWERSHTKPSNDLIAIIISDVPMTCLIGSFVRYKSAGMIKNPPPAPTNPVIPHTTNHSNPITRYCIMGLRSCFVILDWVFLRNMDHDAMSIITANTTIINTDLLKENHQTAIMSGISGMSRLRTIVTQTNDGIPNNNPVRTSTCQALYFGTKAMRLVIHTNHNE